MRSDFCPGIAFLLRGIPIPQLGSTIPWCVTMSEFAILTERQELKYSIARWPLLDFELLGLTVNWGFNFVSDRDKRLTSISYHTLGEKEAHSCYIKTRNHLRGLLGEENCGNNSERQYWHHIGVYVTNEISTGYYPLLRESLTSHCLTVGLTNELQEEIQKTSGTKR